MPFCQCCGQELSPGARFCSNCGTASGKESSDATFERKQVFEGEIRKCPNCGEVLDSMVARCPACGHEIRRTKAASSVRELALKLEQIEAKRMPKESDAPISPLVIKEEAPDSMLKKALGWDFGESKRREAEQATLAKEQQAREKELNARRKERKRKERKFERQKRKEKTNLIHNFPIPNSKEDIFEFMLLASSSIKFSSKERVITKAWMAKMDQVYQKAEIIFNNNTDLEQVREVYEKTKAKGKRRKIIKLVLTLLAVVVCAIVLFRLGKGVSNVLSGIKLPDFSHTNSVEDEFVWLNTGLSTKLPQADAISGRYRTNTDVELDVTIEDVSYSQFEEYITECKNIGYTVDAEKDTTTYEAHNDEGYYLKLQHWSSGNLDIELKAPLTGDEDFKWPDHSFAGMIPEFSGKTGKIETDSESQLKFWLFDVEELEFETYIEACKERGFTIDSEKGNVTFSGFNSEGYKLSLSLGDMKQVSIVIDAPREFANITWPTTGPAALIPKPSSAMGAISLDLDWSFSVYLGNMSIKDFNDYVEKCIGDGFEKDYRSDHYFSADKGEDVSLTVEYVGFDTVYISIDDRSKF